MFKNLIYSLITKGTVALINFLILLFSSRYLGVSSRGEISIFLLNITIIQVMNEVYTGYSVIHFIPKFDLRKIVGYGFCYTLIFCSLSNVVVCFFNKQVPGYSWLGYLISLLVILNTFNCIIILGKENIRMYNFLSFIQPFLLLLGILVYIFMLRCYTFEAYVYPLLFSFLAAFCISAIIVSMFFSKQIPSSEFNLKPLLGKGFAFQVSILMYIFVNRFSYYILPDIANVGLYASASSLMEALLVIVNAVSPLLLAQVANQGNTAQSINMALTLSKASFTLSVIAVLIIFILPDNFFIFALGEGFAGIKTLMLLYAPAIVMMSLSGAISYYFSAIGKQRLVLICYCSGFISTLVLAPVLIKEFGINGAAYNANIAYLLMTIALSTCFIITNHLTVRRFFSFTADYRNLKQIVNTGHLPHKT